MSTQRVSPMPGQVYQQVEEFDTYEGATGRYATNDLDEAKVITSLVDGSSEDNPKHKIVLDIDMPALLLPSSTEGHFHLYIDHEMHEKAYFALLDALDAAGVIEHGYANASKDRGFTAVRLPWVKKETKVTVSDPQKRRKS